MKNATENPFTRHSPLATHRPLLTMIPNPYPNRSTALFRGLRVLRGSPPGRQNHLSGDPIVHFLNPDDQLQFSSGGKRRYGPLTLDSQPSTLNFSSTPANKGRNMLGIAQSTSLLTKTSPLATRPSPLATAAVPTQQFNPPPNPRCNNSTPQNCIFPEEKQKAAVLNAFKSVKKPPRPNSAKNHETSENTVRNHPQAPKVLKYSSTKIRARTRIFRHFAPPHCANIRPENAQQFMQLLVPKLQLRNSPGTLQRRSQKCYTVGSSK
jgi:hypothetical protein